MARVMELVPRYMLLGASEDIVGIRQVRALRPLVQLEEIGVIGVISDTNRLCVRAFSIALCTGRCGRLGWL
jgi:hypothetical protein